MILGAVQPGLGQLPPPPESLPDWMQGEEGARRLLVIVIGAGLAALLADWLLKRHR